MFSFLVALLKILESLVVASLKILKKFISKIIKILRRRCPLLCSCNFLIQFFYNFEVADRPIVILLVASLKIIRKFISKIIKNSPLMLLAA